MLAVAYVNVQHKYGAFGLKYGAFVLKVGNVDRRHKKKN
jgi:hypothetical protein